MKITETAIKDLFLVDVEVHGDQRGYFFENYRESEFASAGLTYKWIQENQSMSSKGVLRGMGFQKRYPQAKLIRVLQGEIFDVAVDLRRDSSTYKCWEGFYLSSENKKQLLIPRGFAHGFVVMSEFAEITYKCDNYYHPEDEAGFIWNDPSIGIQWPFKDNLIISEKDKLLPSFTELNFSY